MGKSPEWLPWHTIYKRWQPLTNTGMICSTCLGNTQNWNCLGGDYRLERWSSGREREERKSSWGQPPTALSPLTSASPQALCQMITLRSPLYAGVVLLIHFQQWEMYASSSPSHFQFLL